MLHDANIFGRVAREKPYISEVNRKKRLVFAKEHLKKSLDFWKMIICSDDSKFNLFSSEGKKYVWRKPNTEFRKQNVLPTVKHGGRNVIL